MGLLHRGWNRHLRGRGTAERGYWYGRADCTRPYQHWPVVRKHIGADACVHHYRSGLAGPDRRCKLHDSTIRGTADASLDADTCSYSVTEPQPDTDGYTNYGTYSDAHALDYTNAIIEDKR